MLIQITIICVTYKMTKSFMNGVPFCPRYELPLLKLSQLKADELLSELALIASQQFFEEYASKIPSSISQEFSINHPKVMEGLILTGDEVISNEERKKSLKSELPESLCVEMEGGSVGQVCYEYDIPWIVIRTISDNANHLHTQIDVRKFVQEASGYYATAILENLYHLIREQIDEKNVLSSESKSVF